MYKDGEGKTHKNIAHIILNYRKNQGWITECDLKPLYLEWYGQSLREDTLRRRLDEMFDSEYCLRARRQFHYKTHSIMVRAYKLTKSGKGLIKVNMAA